MHQLRATERPRPKLNPGGESGPLGAKMARSSVFGPMPSTVIRRFAYRLEARELEVLFVTGRRYLYSDVPPEEAEAFRAAFAKGVYFNRRIRDRYRHRELVD